MFVGGYCRCVVPASMLEGGKPCGKDCGSLSLYAYLSGTPRTSCVVSCGAGVVKGSGLPDKDDSLVGGTSTTGVENCTRRAERCATVSFAGYVGLDGRVDRLGIIAAAADRW